MLTLSNEDKALIEGHYIKDFRLEGITDVVPFVKALDESIDRIDRRRKGEILGYLTRWPKFNKVLGGYLPFECTVVIGARPSVGKSTVSTLLTLDLFQLNPFLPTIVLFFNLEMPNYQQGTRIFSSLSGKSVHELYSAEEVLEESAFIQIKNLRDELKFFNIQLIEIPKSYKEIYDIVGKTRKAYKNHRIVTIFDHTRLITADNERTEEEKIFNLFFTCNLMQKKMKTTNIVISQLNRDVTKQNASSLKYRPPVLSDLFGASAVEQFGNIVILLHRPELDNQDKYDVRILGKPVSVSTKELLIWEIAKNRDGPISRVFMKYEADKNLITQHTKETLVKV